MIKINCIRIIKKLIIPKKWEKPSCNHDYINTHIEKEWQRNLLLQWLCGTMQCHAVITTVMVKEMDWRHMPVTTCSDSNLPDILLSSLICPPHNLRLDKDSEIFIIVSVVRPIFSFPLSAFVKLDAEVTSLEVTSLANLWK